MEDQAKISFRRLAQRLDELPNGFPSTPDGIELELLARLFTPEEAGLAAQLRLTLEPAAEIAARAGRDPLETSQMLKGLARKGLIEAGRTPGGLGYGLMPFVVGFYEKQVERLDQEFAQIFEIYYQQAHKQLMGVGPSVHRIIPVQESVLVDMEIQPYESVTHILDQAQSWGVLDCICRKQKALIGEPCEHPIEMCMAMSGRLDAFANIPAVRALTRQEARTVLKKAAQAGLVHTVTNSQSGVWYICNCCTCSCGVLRGLADLGVANVVARSAFVNVVDEERCLGCENCLPACQFDALTVDLVVHVNETRCVGCGVCVLVCPEEALSLAQRPADQIKPPPANEMEWREQRSQARGIDLSKVL